MHTEILTDNQRRLLPLVKTFSSHFGLVGGTAVALQLGHRRSIDFDLFSSQSFRTSAIRKKILKMAKIQHVIWQEEGQFTLVINDVRWTFMHYPFPLTWNRHFDGIIKMPDLLTLAAMKAYALGQRAKWKDYVDLYFIMKKYSSLKRLVARANHIFGTEFNVKLFRTQLAYFRDIDYSENIHYLPGFKISDAAIRRSLIQWSLQ